ncbi:MAG: transcriptional regulator [Sphingobacteriales bacterium]
MKDRSYKEKKEADAFNVGEDGLVGHPDGAGTNSDGYRKLQEIIMARSAALTADQKREIEFNAIRYRMMEYIQNDDSAEVVEPGTFIRQYLKAANIRQNTFAVFIHSNPGNLGKLLNGTRKINYETAMILGSAFKVDPRIWLHIQDKNEMLRLSKIKRNAYRRYDINNLVKAEVR